MGSAFLALERQITPSREGQSLWPWAPLCITIMALLEDTTTYLVNNTFRHTTTWAGWLSWGLSSRLPTSACLVSSWHLVRRILVLTTIFVRLSPSIGLVETKATRGGADDRLEWAGLTTPPPRKHTLRFSPIHAYTTFCTYPLLLFVHTSAFPHFNTPWRITSSSAGRASPRQPSHYAPLFARFTPTPV